MTGFLLAAAISISPAFLKAPEIQHFPSQYFNTTPSKQLQNRVLALWPGPDTLAEIWSSDQLDAHQKTTLLLGAAVFHDPDLLEIYREALLSTDPDVSLAAAWGYRSLIGDRLPNLPKILSEKDREAMIIEIDGLMASLRHGPLVQMWLASALAAKQDHLPGWTGILMKRSAADSLRSVSRIIEPEDLPYVLSAYENISDMGVKISLVRMLEGLTLQRFLLRPTGPHEGWGSKIYREAFDRVDLFIAINCGHGSKRMLSTGLAHLGLRGVAPGDPAACDAWMRILKMPQKTWWPIATRFIYRCGGPPSQLSFSRRSEEHNKLERKFILDWYGY